MNARPNSIQARFPRIAEQARAFQQTANRLYRQPPISNPAHRPNYPSMDPPNNNHLTHHQPHGPFYTSPRMNARPLFIPAHPFQPPATRPDITSEPHMLQSKPPVDLQAFLPTILAQWCPPITAGPSVPIVAGSNPSDDRSFQSAIPDSTSNTSLPRRMGGITIREARDSSDGHLTAADLNKEESSTSTKKRKNTAKEKGKAKIEE